MITKVFLRSTEYRNGSWYILRSSQGFIGIQFGEAADRPVPADYDGNGKADVAVFRPSNGTWYLNRSQLGFTAVGFGIAEDIPQPADFDNAVKDSLESNLAKRQTNRCQPITTATGKQTLQFSVMECGICKEARRALRA